MLETKLFYRVNPDTEEEELKCLMCQSGWCTAELENRPEGVVMHSPWQCNNPNCQWIEDVTKPDSLITSSPWFPSEF